VRLGWVFLDVGNVLLDEDPLTFFSFTRHVEAVRQVRAELTFFDVLAVREKKALAGSRWPAFEVVRETLSANECAVLWDETAREVRRRFSELSPLIAGAREVVERLAREYHLGLLANQGTECRNWLAELGVLDHFEVVVFAEEVGSPKPEPAIFRSALEMAGAPAAECLMVGDRLDNDIVPAAGLGMLTAWVRWPRREAKGWAPRDPQARAYLESLERLATLDTRNSGDFRRPTLTVHGSTTLTAGSAVWFQAADLKT
jgi:HAD superfamily hydrolase (TIGR01549 family)